jgi:hypothetical protein
VPKADNVGMKPQPSSIPIFEAFTGDTGYRIGGVSDHHIPSGFASYRCVVHQMKLEMVNFVTMKMRFSFTIEGDAKSIETLYAEEQWKFHRTENLLKKHTESASLFKTPAPLFALLLNKYLQVVDAKIHTPGMGVAPPLIFDQSCDLILLPDSYPPLAGLPTGEKYVYYGKKATIFYSDLILNQRYEMEVELEANAGTFEFAPVFPYGKVVIEKFEATSSSEYEFNTMAFKVQSEKTDRFPDWYQESIDHKANWQPRARPNFVAASPFRGEMPLFSMESILQPYAPKTKEEAVEVMERIMIDPSKRMEFDNYETVRFASAIVIPEDKNVEVIVRTIQRPLPPRIYEQMQTLPMYQDVLVRYDLFNMSHEKLRLRVETEILDYTERARKVVYIAPMNNGKGKKSREVIFQCPRLKRGLLEELTSPAKAMMHCVVTNEDTKEVLFEETRNIDLLANDEMIWALKDIRSNTDFELHDFVCAWITPRDKAGLIEKVRSEAAKLRPSKVFGDDVNTLGGIESHARAVYEYLSKNGMSYVNQPFSAVSLPTSQRVVLPEVALSNNAGNCIDLTVLFASILEGVGIFSYIFLTKYHAFIGWGNKNKLDQLLFLETTMIGHASFDDAKEAGKQAFLDNFMFKNGPPHMMPPFLAAEMLGVHIVDTQEVRYSGKIAKRQT